MQENNLKIIVAHPGKQHSFRVAAALEKKGMLFKYATTVYDKKKSLLMRVVKMFLSKDNKQRANGRKCPFIPDEKVVQFCEFEGLLLLLLLRLDKTKRISNWWQKYVSKKFQKKIVRYIIQNKIDVVISYDTNSFVLFNALRKEAPNVIRIMDNAHPNRHFLYYSYHLNWNSCGVFAKTLAMECGGFLVNEKYSRFFGDEVKLADYHIVASSYSKKALLYEGIDSDRIFVVPYGVDKDKFIPNSNKYNNSSKFKVLFIGEVNQRKGIAQILESADQTYGDNIEYNIVGRGKEHCEYLYRNYESKVNFKGRISYDDLISQLAENSVFVFPTMGEGFGLVLLEAMAAGLPVICTPNCAGADLIKDGYNGFIIPVGDSKSLTEKILWLKNHSAELESMSINAVKTAKLYSWDLYNDNIYKSVSKMLCQHCQSAQ